MLQNTATPTGIVRIGDRRIRHVRRLYHAQLADMRSVSGVRVLAAGNHAHHDAANGSDEYSDLDVQNITNFRGHGFQAFLMRTFVDQATAIPFKPSFTRCACTIRPVLPIVAADDAATISAATGGDIFPFANDTINDIPVTQFGVTPSVVSAGGLTGLSFVGNALRVLAGQTATGTRMVTYRICQAVTQTANCQTATVSVTLVANVIYQQRHGNGFACGRHCQRARQRHHQWPGGPTSIRDGQRLDDGRPVHAVFHWRRVKTSIPEGHRVLQPTHQICDITDPMNCKTATVNVTIANVPIVANADSATITTGGGVVSVLATTRSMECRHKCQRHFYAAQSGRRVHALFMGNGQLSFPAPQVTGTFTPQYRICEIASP